MREKRFIRQRQEQWRNFEETLAQRQPKPDELRELFVEITDDLSYARTFYPNRSVRVYLNQLAGQVFERIYQNKRPVRQRIGRFWFHDLPLVFYASRPELLVALLVFVGAMLIGIISTEYDEGFPSVILGETYMRITEQNIAEGDPMAIYKDDDEWLSFLRITINNVRVALLAFLAGVLSAIGTVVVLIYNGIMVGTFQYYFYQQGLFVPSFLTIWIHGTLEISAIVIAGAAGLAMGRGLLFPGTYHRWTAFRMSARRGLLIWVGLVPIFVIAGFLEGFVTGHTDLPDGFKIGIIVSSLLFVVLYVVWYPARVARGVPVEAMRFWEQPPQMIPSDPVVLERVRQLGDVFNDMFAFYRQHMGKLLGRSWWVLLLMSILQAALLFPETTFSSGDAWSSYLQKVTGYATDAPWAFLVGVLHWSFLWMLSLYFLQPEQLSFGQFLRRQGLFVWSVVLVFKGMVWLVPGLFGWGLLLLPVVFYGLYQRLWDKVSATEQLRLLGRQLVYCLLPTLAVLLMLLFVMLIFYLLLVSPIFGLYLNLLDWHFTGEDTDFSFLLLQTAYLAFYSFALDVAMPLLIWGMGFQFLANREYLHGHQLRQRIAQIGVR
ncbi:MAG: stage II sporulation protein M [Bernardetiaceae bacterium]